MSSDFFCPKCKSLIVSNGDGYYCQNCEGFYPLRDGYIDFISEIEFYAGEVSKQQMHILIQEIDSLGYDEALRRFLEKNPSLKNYVTDITRADWVCHCIGKNNLRCLDIGSGLGNISEILSHIYQEVYSLEAVKERIEFQKRRYKRSNRSNIIIARGNALELPFPDNYFDLVVCNGVLEWTGMMNTNLPPRKTQLLFLREVKRVLSSNGCLYIGIENRFGLQMFLGDKDHSGLRYTSLLPRSLANIVVKKFGQSGGIYGDKTDVQKEKRGYFTYTYSIWGYRSLFKEAGLKPKSYWVFPSYNIPQFSGRLDDKIGLKNFISYFKGIVTRYKNILSIVDKLNNSVLKFITSLFIPSFLFYCYKNECQESVDDIIMKNTTLKNYTTLSKPNGILYFLYDKKGTPLKIAHLKRYGYSLSNTIPFHDKTNPNLHVPSERIWIENWIPGKKLNPLKLDEINIVVDWLIAFQNKTRRTTVTQNDIFLEVNALRTSLLQIDHLNTPQYKKWIDEFESYMTTIHVDKTAEHGDFFHENILIDAITHKVNVIDWEHFKEDGNPFFDLIFLIINAMQLPGNPVEEFELNLIGSGKFTTIMDELKNKINNHFGFELNLNILIRYVMLRFIVRTQLSGGSYNQTYIHYNKLLHVLSSKM